MDVVLEDTEYSQPHHQRTASLPRAPSPANVRTSTLRLRSSVVSMKSITSDADPTDILSPVPRRHLSESPSWLKEGAFSDDRQARCVSPLSAASSTPSVFPANGRLSFSVLMEHERHRTALRRTQRDDAADQGAARRWVRWMHRHGMKAWVIPCAIAASLCVKWCIGLAGYSGYATPPMFGDYEAQRHWMELTIHLPVRQWYHYDLEYWGLDYPPLTAYVSWICGKIGSWIEPSWFALDASRGIETAGSKTFMRASVIVLDALVYVPALYFFTRTWHASRSSRTQHVAFVTLLFHPALLLIDFGHFQYNSVMLGFMLLAINAFAAGFDLVGAIFFVLSLGFKQMSLYYAPTIGSYLLGKCIFLGPKEGLRLFVRLALVTSLSFLVLYAPLLPPFSPISAFWDSIKRVFPFSRGLFEDKVANFWCFTNVTVFKWKRVFDGKERLLVKGSAALTALGFLPAVVGLLWGGYKTRLASPLDPRSRPQVPTLSMLLYALLTTSMSFFLFSFQVHEKTILLPLLPLTLLLSGATPGEDTYAWGVLGNVVGVFSMWPLLKRDGLGVPYVAMLLLWCRLVGYDLRVRLDALVHVLTTFANSSMVLLHLLEAVVPPPARYPDLYPVLNVLACTPVFGFVWLWSIQRVVQVGWAIGGLPGSGSGSGAGAGAGTDDKAKGAKEGVQDGGYSPRRAFAGVRREAGVRAVSLGYASGLGGASGGGARGYGDPRRRALERLTRRTGSVDVDAASKGR